MTLPSYPLNLISCYSISKTSLKSSHFSSSPLSLPKFKPLSYLTHITTSVFYLVALSPILTLSTMFSQVITGGGVCVRTIPKIYHSLLVLTCFPQKAESETEANIKIIYMAIPREHKWVARREKEGNRHRDA